MSWSGPCSCGKYTLNRDETPWVVDAVRAHDTRSCSRFVDAKVKGLSHPEGPSLVIGHNEARRKR